MGIGLCLQKTLNDLRVASHRSLHQRSHAVLALGIDEGTGLDQQFQVRAIDRGLGFRSQDQCRVPAVILRIDIGARIDQ